jgi:flagellar hook-associated protein 2
LRGYLEIDEQKLDSALKGHSKDVKQLFGSGTNGDLIIDSGVALKIDQIVNPYVQVGGIVAMREQSLDSQISRSNKEIASMNRRLDQKRADLKDQFARMQGAMTDLQKQSQALGGLGGSTGGSQSSGLGSSGP